MLCAASRTRYAITPERQLRLFALRCLDGLHGSDHAGLQELVQAVRRRVGGNATLCELAAFQDRKRAFVVPGGVQGLPRCSPYAAGALAAWHTAGRAPHDAAFWSAEFAARHYGFVQLGKAAASWAWPEEIEVSLGGSRGGRRSLRKRTPRSKSTRSPMRGGARPILLKSLLSQPFAQFGSAVRGEVYLGEENDAGRAAIYCQKCGVEREDATPGVLFDIRRTRCACCGLPITLTNQLEVAARGTARIRSQPTADPVGDGQDRRRGHHAGVPKLIRRSRRCNWKSARVSS